MREYLLFQLYAPFSSWGSPLPGSIRRTDDHPTKSGVAGLLALSLGITREMVKEYDQLVDGMGFACREDNPGILMKDFHTVQIGKNPVVSDRYYLCSAAFTVCLWKEGNGFTLHNIADALNRPKYMPFLGRKCCIIGLPPTPKIIYAEDLVDAFKEYQPSKLLEKVIHNGESKKVFWEGSDSSIEVTEELKRSDQPLGIFKYGSRTEFVGRIGG